MKLTELQVRGLFAAAKSREIIKRAWLLDAMTVMNEYSHNLQTPQKLTIGEIVEIAADDVKLGQVVCVNGEYLGIIVDESGMSFMVAILSKVGTPIYHRLDTFEFVNRTAALFLGDNVFTQSIVQGVTTVGIFLENIIVLQYPTDFAVFKYINTFAWKAKSILKLTTDALSNGKITVEQYRKFVDHFFYLNHISEICVPSLSVKSLTTDPRVVQIKKEFIEKHKGQMNDPFIIKQLEDMLIEVDKAYLGDDSSVTFFNGLGGKSYSLHRKKLFLMVGGTPAFDEASGRYDFNPNSLMEGWTVDMMPTIANEIRKGSYERGRETAKGGAETKLVMRVFQDVTIDMDDCGTKRTIEADFKNTFRIKDFIGRTIQDAGVDVVLTDENIAKYDGKVVRLYSPMTCENKYNLCYKCCGHKAKQFGVKLIGIQTVKITSAFMNSAMKNMHGTVLQTRNLKLSDVLL